MNKTKTIIIAEAGVNHNGEMDLAKKLVESAAEAGADIIKFQTFVAKDLVINKAQKSDYQLRNTNSHESQKEMLSKLELNKEQHYELIHHCKKNNIEFLSSAFDIKSVKFLDSLNLYRWKIPSGEITNIPYLRLIGSKNKPIILSTGMSNIEEIEKALNILLKSGSSKANITILQCNTEYPTPFKDVNLKTMETIKNIFDIETGFSDHTLGIEASLAAVSLGAKIIEKHITLDQKMIGPDHKASLDPLSFKKMVF